MYNESLKEGFIKDYMRTRVVAQTSLYSLFRKVEPYEEELNKDCSEFTEKEILQMYEEFKKYVKECIELKDMYAKKFGPLTLDQIDSQKYEWQENPWPWDNIGGGMYV